MRLFVHILIWCACRSCSNLNSPNTDTDADADTFVDTFTDAVTGQRYSERATEPETRKIFLSVSNSSRAKQMTSRASFNGCWHQKGHGLEGAGKTGEGMTSSLAASVRCICKFDVCKCALGRYSSPCFGGPQRIPKCPIKVSLFIWQ